MSNKRTKVPVSGRALMARINRKLAHHGEQLFRSRSNAMQATAGGYYIVDMERNVTTGRRVDLGSLGKKLGVLKPYEELA